MLAAKVKALVFQARTTLIADRDARRTPCEDIRTLLETARGGCSGAAVAPASAPVRSLCRVPARDRGPPLGPGAGSAGRADRGVEGCRAGRRRRTQRRGPVGGGRRVTVAPGSLGAASGGGIAGGAAAAGGIAAKALVAKVAVAVAVGAGAMGGAVAVHDRVAEEPVRPAAVEQQRGALGGSPARGGGAARRRAVPARERPCARRGRGPDRPCPLAAASSPGSGGPPRRAHVRRAIRRRLAQASVPADVRRVAPHDPPPPRAGLRTGGRPPRAPQDPPPPRAGLRTGGRPPRAPHDPPAGSCRPARELPRPRPRVRVRARRDRGLRRPAARAPAPAAAARPDRDADPHAGAGRHA